MVKRWMAGGFDRVLWLSFWLLFILIVLSVWLPVEPIIWGFPLWALVVLALMLGAVVIAAITGGYYEWPAQRATGGESR